jgi:hypothetical protein
MGKCRLAEDCAPSGIRKLLGFRLAKSVLDAMDGTNPFEQIGPWTPAGTLDFAAQAQVF